MNKHKNFILSILTIICMGFLFVALRLFSNGVKLMANSNSPHSQQQLFSADQAREKVVEFLRLEEEARSTEFIVSQLQEMSLQNHPNLGGLYIFRGGLGEFWVSRNRGTVITHSAPKRFTVPEAQEYIKAFLRRHIPDFEKRNFVQVDTEMLEPFWKEQWREKSRPPEEVAIFENWVNIQVNLVSRKIHYFNYSDLRHVRKTSTPIDTAGVRRMISQKFPQGKILELGLMEHTTDGGATWMTIWHAVLLPDKNPESPRKLLSINADTGQLVP